MCQALFEIATAIPLYREKKSKAYRAQFNYVCQKTETVFKLRKRGSRDSVLSHYILLPLTFSYLATSLLVLLSKC